VLVLLGITTFLLCRVFFLINGGRLRVFSLRLIIGSLLAGLLVRQLDLWRLGRLAIFVLVVEEQVDDFLAVGDAREATELRVKELYTEPNKVVCAVVSESEETIDVQELIHRHPSL